MNLENGLIWVWFVSIQTDIWQNPRWQNPRSPSNLDKLKPEEKKKQKQKLLLKKLVWTTNFKPSILGLINYVIWTCKWHLTKKPPNKMFCTYLKSFFLQKAFDSSSFHQKYEMRWDALIHIMSFNIYQVEMCFSFLLIFYFSKICVIKIKPKT